MNTPAIDKGIYYHYKHDPRKGINDHAYEVIGLGLHTEDSSRTVIYRPLYKNTFLNGADFCIRPYEMFIGTVEISGEIVPRFKRIIDPDLIEKLKGY